MASSGMTSVMPKTSTRTMRKTGSNDTRCGVPEPGFIGIHYRGKEKGQEPSWPSSLCDVGGSLSGAEPEPALARRLAIADVIRHLFDGVHRDHRHVVVLASVFFFLRNDLVFILPVDHRVAAGEYLAALEHFPHVPLPARSVECKRRLNDHADRTPDRAGGRAIAYLRQLSRPC